jgi:hypothetical protein
MFAVLESIDLYSFQNDPSKKCSGPISGLIRPPPFRHSTFSVWRNEMSKLKVPSALLKTLIGKKSNQLWALTVIILLVLLSKCTRNHNIVASISGLSENKSQNQIPSIVHFVVGQGDRRQTQLRYQLSTPFEFINYITFLAARRHLRPKKFFVHYFQEPNTFWWNQMKKNPEINAILVRTRQVNKIFKKFVDHHSHRGDIIRLEVLIKYGGIYLDTDVLTLRSFDPLLNLSDVIMAHENDNPRTACNAVILAKSNAKFLRRWYDAFQSFDQNCWGCHSVLLPWKLASIYTDEIKVLPTNTFLRPRWGELKNFYESNDYNFASDYASHLWNKINNAYLSKLTPDIALNANTTLARMIRHAIGSTTLRQLKKILLAHSSD